MTIKQYSLDSKGRSLISVNVTNPTNSSTNSYDFLVDTAASNVRLSQRVIDDLGLTAVGETDDQTTRWIGKVNVYEINIELPEFSYDKSIKAYGPSESADS